MYINIYVCVVQYSSKKTGGISLFPEIVWRRARRARRPTFLATVFEIRQKEKRIYREEDPVKYPLFHPLTNSFRILCTNKSAAIIRESTAVKTERRSPSYSVFFFFFIFYSILFFIFISFRLFFTLFTCHNLCNVSGRSGFGIARSTDSWWMIKSYMYESENVSTISI